MRGIRAFATTLAVAGALSVVLLAPACGSDQVAQDGSQTHFLSACETGCAGGLACLCGVCTRVCSATAECTPLAPGAECVAGPREPAAACPGAASAAFCDLTM